MRPECLEMRILHAFIVIIFMIILTWTVSVVTLASQPRRLAVGLGGQELVWGRPVLAKIAGASGNQFYYHLIIYSVSPFKSQLLKLFGASWKFLWKLSLANNFSVVIQPNLLFILDTRTYGLKYLFIRSHLRLLSMLFPRLDFLEALLDFCPPMFWLVMFTTRLNSANFLLDSSSDDCRDVWETPNIFKWPQFLHLTRTWRDINWLLWNSLEDDERQGISHYGWYFLILLII